jgi:hypothetical protein
LKCTEAKSADALDAAPSMIDRRKVTAAGDVEKFTSVTMSG